MSLGQPSIADPDATFFQLSSTRFPSDAEAVQSAVHSSGVIFTYFQSHASKVNINTKTRTVCNQTTSFFVPLHHDSRIKHFLNGI